MMSQSGYTKFSCPNAYFFLWTSIFSWWVREREWRSQVVKKLKKKPVCAGVCRIWCVKRWPSMAGFKWDWERSAEAPNTPWIMQVMLWVLWAWRWEAEAFELSRVGLWPEHLSSRVWEVVSGTARFVAELTPEVFERSPWTQCLHGVRKEIWRRPPRPLERTARTSRAEEGRWCFLRCGVLFHFDSCCLKHLRFLYFLIGILHMPEITHRHHNSLLRICFIIVKIDSKVFHIVRKKSLFMMKVSLWGKTWSILITLKGHKNKK